MLRNLDTARYQIDPKIPNQTKPNHPCVAICKVATRLRTNNVLRDHQFNAIKCRCGHVATRSHILIQCTELKLARLRVFQQITDNLTKPNQTKPTTTIRLPINKKYHDQNEFGRMKETE
ncbi:hypothetical protein LOTGIDRAFT_159040 [Lottia gigantea]|uniref:Uncharacterized protein n=1 Tax=Lottia gigantea TaxID=225164 RepID=V4ATK5_LOTGI|nr:hypothetical protein LOTGIDRAFT_159040 [Lottia gigantea]ESO98245.1 hypothetical protein LOTGIDRAFT_159040 [Lottia gigantea]